MLRAARAAAIVLRAMLRCCRVHSLMAPCAPRTLIKRLLIILLRAYTMLSITTCQIERILFGAAMLLISSSFAAGFAPCRLLHADFALACRRLPTLLITLMLMLDGAFSPRYATPMIRYLRYVTPCR